MSVRTGKWTLLALGVLLAANLVVFFTYRVQQKQRIDELRARRATLESELSAAEAQRDQANAQIASVKQLEGELDRIYNETWGRPDERLTPLLRELYRLARESGLQPSARSYSNEQSLREGEATAMTIAFGVDGTYDQLRRMIHLIETSDQYVVIDSLTLADAAESGSRLSINMQLRTLFREPPRVESRASRRRS